MEVLLLWFLIPLVTMCLVLTLCLPGRDIRGFIHVISFNPHNPLRGCYTYSILQVRKPRLRFHTRAHSREDSELAKLLDLQKEAGCPLSRLAGVGGWRVVRPASFEA